MGREEQQGSDEITRKGAAIIREEIKGERKKLRQRRHDGGGRTRGRGEEERMAGILEWRMMWRQLPHALFQKGLGRRRILLTHLRVAFLWNSGT